MQCGRVQCAAYIFYPQQHRTIWLSHPIPIPFPLPSYLTLFYPTSHSLNPCRQFGYTMQPSSSEHTRLDSWNRMEARTRWIPSRINTRETKTTFTWKAVMCWCFQTLEITDKRRCGVSYKASTTSIQCEEIIDVSEHWRGEEVPSNTGQCKCECNCKCKRACHGRSVYA